MKSDVLRWSEKEELKKNINWFGKDTAAEVKTEDGDFYNNSNNKRKNYWRVREGQVIRGGKFFVLLLDKNMRFCNTPLRDMGPYDPLRTMWPRIIDICEDNLIWWTR